MIKMICDRCGKEIEGTTYYTVSIYAADINPKTEYTTSASAAIQNLSNALSVFNAKPQYCKKCRDEIEAFINNKYDCFVDKDDEYDDYFGGHTREEYEKMMKEHFEWIENMAKQT